MRRKVRKIIDSQSFFCTFFLHFLVGSSAFLGRRWRVFGSAVARCTASIFRFSICIFSLFGLHFFAKSQSHADKKTNAWPSPTTHFSTKFVARKIRHAHKNLARKTPSLLRSQKTPSLLRSQKTPSPLRSQKTPSPPRPLRSPTRRMGCSPREISQDRPDAPTHG